MDSITPLTGRQADGVPASFSQFRWLFHLEEWRAGVAEKRPLLRRAMFIGFTVIRAMVRRMPLPVAQAFGAACGYGPYGLLHRQRSLIWRQLEEAFGPSLSVGTKHRIARRLFVNLGKTVMEWFVLDRLSPTQIQRVVEVHGLRHLHQALDKGHGVIAVSAHFGNWELLSIVLASFGFRGGVVARRLRYPEYEAFLRSMRQRKGVTTCDRGSLKDVMRLLQANQIIGMMPDQDIDSLQGVFVDFFGRPAYTPVGPAALALMSGAPILPCFIMRNGRRFRIAIEEPLPVSRCGDRTRDLTELTQIWSRVVESYIRCYPDHWVWMHRRWKTRPSAALEPSASTPSSVDASYTTN